MTWITMGRGALRAGPDVIGMLREAVSGAPHDARRYRALGRASFAKARYDDAVEAFSRSLALDKDLAGDWPSMIAATIEVDGSRTALKLLQRWPGEETSAWHHANATALQRHGSVAAADAAFRRAVGLGDSDHEAARGLLRMHAEARDGAALLDACTWLAPVTRARGAVLGYRALALSLLRREAEANALVDLDAGIMRVRFDPPGGVGLAKFNSALGDAILADQPPASGNCDVLINHAIALPDSSEMTALQAFVRVAYDRYLDAVVRPDASFMPRITGDTSLEFGAVTLRRGGRNGQHLHPAAYLTAVYHVSTPAAVGKDAGALVLGECDEIAPGHAASWGTRVLPAEPGVLTIFPAHYFHDVRPTGVDDARTVVVSDLGPAA